MERPCRLRLACVLCAVLLALGGELLAQTSGRNRTEARVTAQLSSGVVKLGADAVLLVTVENASFSEIRELPKVEGLDLGPLGPPSMRQSFFRDVNGRTTNTAERTWAIPVRPRRTGEFKIPPLTLNVDGSEASTPELALTVVADLKGEDLGFFRIQPSTSKIVEGQPFSIELRFGWDQAKRINYANLSLPWWGQLPGALEMEAGPTRAGAQEFEIGLNSNSTVKVEEIQPEIVRGRPFRTFRAVRTFTPTRSNALEFPTSFLEFGTLVESRDWINSRREKVESYYARAEGFSIEVVPLPEAGRPLDYGGAIGRLQVRATAEPRDVDAGDSIKFTVEYSGEGNLEFFTAPDPARVGGFESFRVYGKTESKTFDRRKIVYDLAPTTSEVHEIPPLPLPVFDPTEDRYTVVATQPLAIRVRALSKSSGLEAPSAGTTAAARDIRDIHSDPRPGDGPARPGAPIAASLLAAAPVVWLAMRTAARRRQDPREPAERRRRLARKELQRALARAGLAPQGAARAELDAFEEFLAARTRERREAWEGRDASAWFAERHSGSPQPELIREIAGLLRELERAAWGDAALVPTERLLEAAERWIESEDEVVAEVRA
jgi:oxygen tolerance protein BatD